MARAKKLIEGLDDPDDGFDLKGHLQSPVARFAAGNGFVRDDRSDREERWVKKLSNGKEAWLVSDPDARDEPIDMRDPRNRGGRQWHFMLATPSDVCTVCMGTGKQGGGPCQPCNSTGKQDSTWVDFKRIMTGNEFAMNAVLSALLQRLATWPAGVPKPGEPGGENPFK